LEEGIVRLRDEQAREQHRQQLRHCQREYLDRKEPTGPNDAELLMSFVTLRINNGTGMRYSDIIG
jgi:hypothetical protein